MMFIPVLPSGVDEVPIQNATLLDTDGWWFDWLTGGAKSSSGQSVSEASAIKVSAVFACVRNIAEDIGKLPFILYKRLQPRGKERADNLPLYSLLHDDPNPELDSMTWRQVAITDALLGGNHYSEIVRNPGGEVESIWPICRDRVTPKLTQDDAQRLYYEVKSPNGGFEYLPKENMFHLRGMGNEYVGWSVIRLAKESIGGAMASEEHGNKFFSEGAVPSGVLQHPGKMSKEKAALLADSWEKRYSGTRRVAVLEEGMTYNAMTVSNNDSQFLESRQFSVEEIARWFRMPPHKIMHLLRSTFSNIEEQNIEYVVDCLTSWAARLEHETRRKLIPKRRKDLFAEVLFEGMLRGDALKRAQVMKEKIYSGQLSPNDARVADGMNPVDGGDNYFIPSTMVTLETAAKPPEPPPAPIAPQTPESEPEEEETDDSDDETAENRARMVLDAHADVLVDAIARLLHKEADKVERSAGKSQGAHDLERFYADHAARVTADLQAPLEAFAVSYWAVLSAVPMAPEAKLAVLERIRGISGRHIEQSLAELPNANAKERWTNGERASEFAVRELCELAALVKDILGRYRSSRDAA